MAIVLRQPAEAQLYGEAGRIIGEAARAKEEYRRATEIAERLAGVKAQQEMTMFQHQLDLDRMKFQQLMNFEEEKRARTWQLEKMEIASKLDFAEEEKRRAQTNAEYETGMKYIAENKENWPEGLAEKAEFDLYFDKKVKAPAVSYPTPTTERMPSMANIEALQVLGYGEDEIKEMYGLSEPTDALTKQPTAETERGAVPSQRRKGLGYFGELKRPDGKVSTELSIGVQIDGKETEIPSLVPTLTKTEIDYLLAGNKPTRKIVQKAVDYAKQRRTEGKDVFAQKGEQYPTQQSAQELRKQNTREAYELGKRLGYWE